MKTLFRSIDEIATECRDVAVMFSCGRDSTVMLDLFMTRAKPAIGAVYFLYYCPGLSYEEKILTYYEKRYGITITRLAHPDCTYLVNSRTKAKRLKMADLEKLLRSDYGVQWSAWGYRKDESLQRRGQLSMAENGIDYKYRKVFPIGEWAERHAKAYVAKQRLLLPPEYKMGFRDLNTFKGRPLLHIYNNYRSDYEKIVAMYPDVQGDLMRAVEDTR